MLHKQVTITIREKGFKQVNKDWILDEPIVYKNLTMLYKQVNITIMEKGYPFSSLQIYNQKPILLL